MSRIGPANVIKVVAAISLWMFDAFLLLVIGLAAKKKKVALEGAIYAAVFVFAVFSLRGGASAFLGLGAWILSISRAIWLRDLWLPVRTRRAIGVDRSQPPAPPSIASSAINPLPSRPVANLLIGQADDLSSALAWVASSAKQNKHRLPSAAYVTVLEVCQTLDAVIDTETRQPSADAGFEYELEAMVRQYLPKVLHGYLSVPPSMVNSRQPNGRTPTEELLDQLDLLSGQADSLHSSRHGRASAELSSMGNFLRERFGPQQREVFDFGISSRPDQVAE